MRSVARKNQVAAVAASVAVLALLGNAVLSRSPVPLAFLALGLLTVGLHVPSLDARARQLIFAAGIVAGLGSIALTVAKFI